jgi:hypothetical protein
MSFMGSRILLERRLCRRLETRPRKLFTGGPSGCIIAARSPPGSQRISMPFDNVDEIKDPAEYKKILKAELNKVKANPVKFQYFENFPFKGGAKPLVIVGPYKDDFINAVKGAGAAFKAKGRCLERDEKLHFSADQGTLVPAKLNLALKVADAEAEVVADLKDAGGKAEVLAEPQATGEVVSGPGGKPAPALTSDVALAKAQAQFQALCNAFNSVKSRMTESERREWRDRIWNLEAQLTPAHLAAGLVALNQVKVAFEKHLASLANAQARKTQTAAAEIDQAHGDAQRVADAAVAAATLALTTAQTQATAASKAVAKLVTQPQNTKKRDWDTMKADAAAALTKANLAVQKETAALAKVPRDPKIDRVAVAALEARFLELSKGLQLAAKDLAAAHLDGEGSLEPGVGRIAQNAPLAEARAEIAPQVAAKGKIVDALKRQETAVKALRARWTALAQRINTETGHAPDPQAIAPLVTLETELAALLAEPPHEITFDARFSAAAKTIGARFDGAEKALGALAQHIVAAKAVSDRLAVLAQGVLTATGAALDPAARQPFADHETALAAARESLARNLGFSPAQLDTAPAKLTSVLDAADQTLQSLQQALAAAQAQIDRFVQLEKSAATATGLAIDPAARAPRSDLEAKMLAAKREVARTLSFDPATLDAAALKGSVDAAEPQVQALSQAAAAVAAMNTRFTQLAQRCTLATGNAAALSNAALQPCQQQLTAAKQGLARTLAFDKAALDAALLACGNWATARELVFDKVEARAVSKTYDAEMKKKANANNGLLPKLKSRLDVLLAAAAAPPADELLDLLVLLAPIDAKEQLARSKLNDTYVEDSLKWGTAKFTNPLLKEVWKATSKGVKGGDVGTISGYTLEQVEAAIPLWAAAGANAPGAVSNLHTPGGGGGRPQYKQEKDVTRAVVQANFISQWSSNSVNVHVEVTTCAEGNIGKAKSLNFPLLNKLIDTDHRISRST